jgi:hypothetical protein
VLIGSCGGNSGCCNTPTCFSSQECPCVAVVECNGGCCMGGNRERETDCCDSVVGNDGAVLVLW